jgi:bacterioferritin-associated ferredoxin
MNERERQVVVCRCEEVTEEEIRQAIKKGARTFREIKKITRAGMGICQGKSCQRLVNRILAEATGRSVEVLDLDTPRPPLRPVKLSLVKKGSDSTDPPEPTLKNP